MIENHDEEEDGEEEEYFHEGEENKHGGRKNCTKEDIIAMLWYGIYVVCMWFS